MNFLTIKNKERTCAFRICQLIGKGNSSVYRSVITASISEEIRRGDLVATKILNIEEWDNIDFEIFNNELKIMNNLFHHNIIKYYDYEYNNINKKNKQNIDFKHISLIQEYCPNKDLFTNLNNFGAFDEDIAKIYGFNLLNVVKFLHSNNIAHIDIKLENIIFDEKWNIKLCDFEHAIKWDKSIQKPLVSKTGGTYRYRSPELLMCINSKYKAKEDSSFEIIKYNPTYADTWASCIVFFEILLGISPFNNAEKDTNCFFFRQVYKNNWGLFWKTINKNFLNAETNLSKLTNYMKDFFQNAFYYDIEERFYIDDLISHNYLKEESNFDDFKINKIKEKKMERRYV